MNTSRRLPALILLTWLLSWVLLPAAVPTLTSHSPTNLSRGSTTTMTVKGTFAPWPCKVWVEGEGVTFTPAKKQGEFSVTVAADAQPGPRLFRLYNTDGASVPRILRIDELPEVKEQEPNDDFRKPQVLKESRVVVTGKLRKAGDVDCFAVKAQKGRTLVASMEANRLGSPMDGVLQILSEDGFVLEQNHDYHGLDPHIAYTIPKDGTYIVRAYAFPATPDSSIRFAGGENYVYRLTITTGPYVEQAFPLAVSRSNPGSVALLGWNLPASAKEVKVIPDEEGQQGRATLPDVVGSSTVVLESHPTLVRNRPSTGEPQTIPAPCTVSGRIVEGDEVHTYRFKAKKGQRFQVDLAAGSIGSPILPELKVTDAKGKSLSRSRDRKMNPNPSVPVTIPADGVYQIQVSDLGGTTGPVNVYRLRVGTIEPDLNVSVPVDRFTINAGKELTIPVTVLRLGGFEGDVELKVENLPEGVTAVVPSKVTARMRMVNVILKAGKPGSAGAFRIVGQTSETRRYARVTVKDVGPVSHLWVTVGK